MKIITCGPIVTYLITEHHVATIVYSYNNGTPSATIYYDGQLGETIEAENGRPCGTRYAAPPGALSAPSTATLPTIGASAPKT